MQEMLRSEHGGMNDVFVEVYQHMAENKYLELAGRFSHRALLNPLLARELGKALEIPVETNNLVKIRETLDQSSLDSSKRKQNVLDAFNIRNSAAIEGKTILLLDDVLTTCGKVELVGVGVCADYTATS